MADTGSGDDPVDLAAPAQGLFAETCLGGSEHVLIVDTCSRRGVAYADIVPLQQVPGSSPAAWLHGRVETVRQSSLGELGLWYLSRPGHGKDVCFFKADNLGAMGNR